MRRYVSGVETTGRWAAGERRWLDGVGHLRELVRQELVHGQLVEHLPPPPCRVLDVGCGQGTQVLRLAALGFQVTGLDSSDAMRGIVRDAAVEAGLAGQVDVVAGDAADLGSLFPPGSFDVVLCHGVLMYFDDPRPVILGLAQVLAPGGVLSLLVRNGDALALRPGLAGDWVTAAAAFDSESYGNRLGITARADRRSDLTARLAQVGLGVETWYGVRLFADLAADDAPVPGDTELAALLAVEGRAGRTDPYRGVAALTHLIARRSP